MILTPIGKNDLRHFEYHAHNYAHDGPFLINQLLYQLKWGLKFE
jgi:hypothetical protein